MYHTLVFTADFTGDLEVSPHHHLQRMQIRQGTRVQAKVKPYVAESDDGPIEVADLFFEDGTATRAVRFACFEFVD